MSVVTILGAGNGGAAAAAELALGGHRVRLWNRSAATLKPFRDLGGVRFEGAIGNGIARAEALTTDLPEALEGAGVALVCLPATAHEHVASELARARAALPVVLNPGHTGGA
ncbi:MAG: 2-dehydropantoate 2-reductase N-terminal domain-containing protein, partial [Actinomycetota bacterium]